MKIFNGQYGWCTSANSNDTKAYPSVDFPKDDIPSGTEIEGRLWFEQNDGVRRECFLSSYKKKDGSIAVKLVMSKDGGFKKKVTIEQTTLRGDGKDLTGHYANDNKVTIETDDLPFY